MSIYVFDRDNAVNREFSINEQLASARDLIEIFELVKRAVIQRTGRSRPGLMLGLANLGGGPEGFIGAFYPIASNVIVMNTLPLRRIEETDPSLRNPYIFHLLLHEYLHALGIIDEGATKKKALEISREIFGEQHIVTQLAADLSSFMPNLVYPVYGWQPHTEFSIEIVKGFDRSSTDSYIA